MAKKTKSAPKLQVTETPLAILTIPIDRILVDPAVACRDFNPETDGYKTLLASVEMTGFRADHPLTVLPANEDGKYVLVNGRHRYEAAQEAGLKVVPCVIGTAGENTLEVKMAGWLDNASSTPMELAEEAILVSAKAAELKAAGTKGKELMPLLLEAFHRTNKNWVRVRINFAKLSEATRAAFIAGEIGVAHLDALTTPKVLAMTEEEQLKLLEKAKRTPGGIFQSYLDAPEAEVAKKKAKKAVGEATKGDDEEGNLHLEAVGVRSPKVIARTLLNVHEKEEATRTSLNELEKNSKYEDGSYDEEALPKIMKLRERMAELGGKKTVLAWVLKLDMDDVSWYAKAQAIGNVEIVGGKSTKPEKLTGKAALLAKMAEQQAAKDAEADGE